MFWRNKYMQCSVLTSADLEAISAIEKASQAFPWSTQKLEDCLRRFDAVCFGAKQNGVLYGYILGGTVLDEAEIWNFAVMPEFQRQGIVKALLKYFLDFLTIKSVKQVFLEVRRSNQAAIACYQKAGFRQVGLRKDYYPTESGREDGILMCLVVGATGGRPVPGNGRPPVRPYIIWQGKRIGRVS